MKDHQENLKRYHEQEDPLIQKALDLKNQGQFEKAVEILLPVAGRHPKIAGVHGLIGGLMYLMDRLKEAERFFRRTVEINPRSELATRGLFHAIWDQGREEEAIQVLREYSALTGSAEFDEILEAYEAQSEE